MHRFAKQVAKLKANPFLINGKGLPKYSFWSAHQSDWLSNKPCLQDKNNHRFLERDICRACIESRGCFSIHRQVCYPKTSPKTESGQEKGQGHNRISIQGEKDQTTNTGNIHREDKISGAQDGVNIDENVSTAEGGGDKNSAAKETELQDAQGGEKKSLTAVQKFKRDYKKYGTVVLGVHLCNSAFWLSSFYCVAHMGVDLVPLLEYFRLSETVVQHFRPGSHLGDFALAYAMYKIISPARYTITVVAAPQVIKYLKKTGRMANEKDKKVKDKEA